jgi:hypothetical protein
VAGQRPRVVEGRAGCCRAAERRKKRKGTMNRAPTSRCEHGDGGGSGSQAGVILCGIVRGLWGSVAVWRGAGLCGGCRIDVVANGARGVEDDLRGSVCADAVHDDYAAKHETEGVGEDGSAADGNAAFGDQDDDIGEDGGDVVRGPVGAVVDSQDVVGEIEGVVEAIRSFTSTEGMTTAQAGGRVLGVEAALAARTVTSLAASKGAGRGWRMG